MESVDWGWVMNSRHGQRVQVIPQYLRLWNCIDTSEITKIVRLLALFLRKVNETLWQIDSYLPQIKILLPEMR